MEYIGICKIMAIATIDKEPKKEYKFFDGR